jgi:hypothetical protein
MKIRDDAGAWVDEEFETLDLGDPRRSPASAMYSGIDFSLSGTAHLLAAFRLSLQRAAYSSRWIDILQSMIVRIAKYCI